MKPGKYLPVPLALQQQIAQQIAALAAIKVRAFAGELPGAR